MTTGAKAEAPPEAVSIVETKSLTKRYPGVLALDAVSIGFLPGEIHGLAGENGAGKSTLVKLLTGAIPPDSGQLLLEGKAVRFASPTEALHAGIAAVFQHFSLVADMTVAENIFLGHWPLHQRRIDYVRAESDASGILDSLGVDIDPTRLVRRLGAGDRQVVEIAKALARSPNMLLLDEPTSGLPASELTALFEAIRRLRDQGVSILYISHRLEEVLGLADRVSVLRDGRHVVTVPSEELSHDELVEFVAGRKLVGGVVKSDREKSDQVALLVHELSADVGAVQLRDISFSVRQGEIVGVTGILGSGKDELGHCLFGVEHMSAGHLELDGEGFQPRGPGESIARGVGYLTDDRHRDGLVLGMTVKANITLASLSRFTALWHIRGGDEAAEAARLVGELHIRAPSVDSEVASLSGGNQQKTVIAKWLATEARVLILHEPTRGVDVGSKAELFRLIVDQAAAGVAVLIISEELDELISVCDRILVMRTGRIVASNDSDDVTANELLQLATAQDAKDATDGIGTP